jgi:hypothetical protein
MFYLRPLQLWVVVEHSGCNHRQIRGVRMGKVAARRVCAGRVRVGRVRVGRVHVERVHAGRVRVGHVLTLVALTKD